MNRRELAALICKTLALLMFALAAFLSVSGVVVLCLSLIFAPFRGGTDWHQLTTTLILCIPLLSVVVVGIIYWRKAPEIAALMVPDDPSPVTSAPITVQDVMMIAFSTAGLFILVAGVRDFISLVYLANRVQMDPLDFWMNPQTLSVLFQLGFSIFLILGPRGMVNAIHRFRTAEYGNAGEQGDSAAVASLPTPVSSIDQPKEKTGAETPS